MTTYTGTQVVDPGLYWAVKPLKLTSVDERGPLPGTEDRTWHRVPMLLMLIVAPLLGLAFVIFLPYIAFATVLRLVGEVVGERARDLAAQASRALQPAWAPARAFFTRAKTVEPEAGTPETPDAWAEDVERRLAGDQDDTADDTADPGTR